MANYLINQNDMFVEYHYSITEFFIIFNDETIELPLERIVNFKIENYFEEATFPLFKVSVMLEPSRYYKILKNKDSVKFKFRLQSFYTNAATNETSLLRDVINDTFILFPEDENSDYQRELKEEAGTDNDINELDKIDNLIDIFLFNDSIVTGLRSLINVIPEKCDLTTLVVYLLYKAGVKKVLMSPFDNLEVYKEILLPPQSIEKQLKYLNNNYGFHKKGTMIFFGLFHSYILNYKGGCTAWYKNEWKESNLLVLEKTNNMSYLDGVIIKHGEKKYYYNLTTEGLSINTPTVSQNVLSGTDATIIDMKGNTSSNVSSDVKVVGKVNRSVIFNDTSNKYMSDVFKAQQKANETVLNIVLENGVLESFNPNKSFSVIFETSTLNSKYKGNYKIASAGHFFLKSGDYYNLKTVLTLRKIE